MLVIGAEHTPAVIFLRQQGQQRLQVPGGGALPDHNELTPAQLFQGVLHIRALVVGVDAGGNIGIEVIAPEARRVAVDLLVMGLRGHDLRYGGPVRRDDAGEIHHLRQALNPGMLKEAVDIPVVQIGAALVHGGRGNTGGDHKTHIHRKILRSGQHIINAVGAHDVGDLMGIGNHRGGAVGNHRPGKLRRADQAGLQVDMGVDKAGADDPPGHIHLRLPMVAAQAHDQPLGNRDVPGVQLPGEHIHIGGVFQHQVGFLPPRCHIDNPLLFNQLPVDLPGPAFRIGHILHPFNRFLP